MKLSYSWLAIARQLHDQAQPTTEFYVLCVLAAAITSLGLLMNNGTAVIGGILIAPLMGPMLGIGFSALSGRRKSALHAAYAFITGFLLIIVISYLVSLPFMHVGITAEMASRTRPTLLNLLIAFPAGYLAAYTRMRPSMSDKVYGVAMSVVIIPSLCIIGIALAESHLSLMVGAALMFFSNLIGILVSSFLAFALADFNRLRTNHLNRLIIPAITIVVLAIPLSFTFYEIAESNRLQQTLMSVLDQKRSIFPHLEITDVDINVYDEPIAVALTLRTTLDDTLPEHSEAAMQKQIEDIQTLTVQRFGKPVHLIVHLLPAKTFYGR